MGLEGACAGERGPCPWQGVGLICKVPSKTVLQFHVPAVQKEGSGSLAAGRTPSDCSEELRQPLGVWLLRAAPQRVQELLHLPLLSFLLLGRHKELTGLLGRDG